jgi:hypothetical protein
MIDECRQTLIFGKAHAVGTTPEIASHHRSVYNHENSHQRTTQSLADLAIA